MFHCKKKRRRKENNTHLDVYYVSPMHTVFAIGWANYPHGLDVSFSVDHLIRIFDIFCCCCKSSSKWNQNIIKATEKLASNINCQWPFKHIRIYNIHVYIMRVFKMMIRRLAGKSESQPTRNETETKIMRTRDTECREKEVGSIRDTNGTEWQYFTRTHSYSRIKTTWFNAIYRYIRRETWGMSFSGLSFVRQNGQY